MSQLRFIGITVTAAVTAMGLIAARSTKAPVCAPDNGGMTLPAGFCATVFADSLLAPRHVWTMPNGDVYVALSGRGRGNPGGVVLLRDADNDGKAEVRTDVVRGFTTSEVAVFENHLYTEDGTNVLRVPIKAGEAAPTGPMDTIVTGLPPGGNHPRKTFAIARDGSIYVNVGSSSNACEARGANVDVKHPPDPCTERDTRAGIWRFDARKTGQHQADGVHFALGYRNGVGLTIGPDGKLWGVQHGRDALYQNFPQYFDQKVGAENPAEELLQVNNGDDFGWPYCFYSLVETKLVDAPEYGGDGKKTDRCASKKGPVAAFPGHWAPNGLAFYNGNMFPSKYRGGVFIAFHGSWNRAPEPQDGFRIVFQPIKDGKASGPYEIFADKVNRATGGDANRRPSGVGVGPDGSLYIVDDSGGRMWKVIYTGK